MKIILSLKNSRTMLLTGIKLYLFKKIKTNRSVLSQSMYNNTY